MTTEQRFEKIEAEQVEMKEQQAIMSQQLKEIATTLSNLSAAVNAILPGAAAASTQAAEGTSASAGSEFLPADGFKETLPPTLPSFDGTDPIGWLARANQQFELHHTSPETKVFAALVAMEDAALYWFSWIRTRKPNLSWGEFSQALIARFDTRFKGSSFERLADVKQSGTVDEYVTVFMQLASQVPGLSDEHDLGNFMKGLVDTVRSSLRLLRLVDLETAMELARATGSSILIPLTNL
ncbi:hypothetical protein CASFOL_018588 [Castilleja foliolosa]|uniref:Retrotransposon gag domain-containing protein n=1 Tax=Castilleja foliolosa TaxID=1961234 RepID=A0ABD3D939_9LAMI